MEPLVLPESDDKLLEECLVETFRASGKGGQHVNKTDSAVRLRHLPSGLVVASQRERSQYLNKRICLEKLREKAAAMNETPAERKPTHPPRSAKRAKKKAKTHKAAKKRQRSRDWRDGED